LLAFIFELLIFGCIVTILFGIIWDEITGILFGGGTEITNDELVSRTHISIEEHGNYITIEQKNSLYALLIDLIKLRNGEVGGTIELFLSGAKVLAIILALIFSPIIILKFAKFISSRMKFRIVSYYIIVLLLLISTTEFAAQLVAKGFALIRYKQEFSDNTMKVLEFALEKGKKPVDSTSSSITPKIGDYIDDRLNTKSLRVDLGDRLITVQNQKPPNLCDLIQSDEFKNADEAKRNSLIKKQIKSNVIVLRRLAFDIYSRFDHIDTNNNNNYTQLLINFYYQEQQKSAAQNKN
jgi:hypothetical protein